MKKLLIALLLIGMMFASPAVRAADHTYTNNKLADGKTITLDGKADDWAGVTAVNVTLKPAHITSDLTFDAGFASVHDATNIYFLIQVKDTFRQGAADGGFGAVAIATNINDSVSPAFMGAAGKSDADINTTTGYVDLVHFEPATDVGANTKTTDAIDDWYAKSPYTIADDNGTTTAVWNAAWGFSGAMANGTTGLFTYEFSRPLNTNDSYDAQYAEGSTKTVAIAFWTPNQTADNVWTDDGHFVCYDNPIVMTLSSSVAGAPGFSLYMVLPAVFVAAVIIRKKKFN